MTYTPFVGSPEWKAVIKVPHAITGELIILEEYEALIKADPMLARIEKVKAERAKAERAKAELARKAQEDGNYD